MEKFPLRLKKLRGERTREEFAALVGISARSLVNYESGARVPKADVIKLICTATKVSSDWLLFGRESSDVSDTIACPPAQQIEISDNNNEVVSDVGQNVSADDTEARLRREVDVLNGEITRLYKDKRDLNREYYEACEALDAASIQRAKLLEERDAAFARIKELEKELCSLKTNG